MGEDKAALVTVVAALNKGYLPCFEAMVQSLFHHSSPDRAYEVIVASADISQADLDPVRRATCREGFSVSLLDLSPHMQEIDALPMSEGFPREIFFRLLLPDALPDCRRVVYLDCDLVVLEDIARLYDADLGGMALGACRDVGMAGMAEGYDPAARAYLVDEVGMGDPLDYFSSGVLVWDLDAARARHPFAQLATFIASHALRYGDQDALNHFYEGDVCYLDMRWNTLFDSEGIRVSQIVPHAPAEMRAAYERARANPAVFHYAGPYKPWMARVDGSDLFWGEARFSCGYEELVARLAHEASRLDQKDLEAKLWKTFDDVYFQLSEAERIRHDLHVRTTRVEAELSALRDENAALRRELEELKHASLCAKVRRKLESIKAK